MYGENFSTLAALASAALPRIGMLSNVPKKDRKRRLLILQNISRSDLCGRYRRLLRSPFQPAASCLGTAAIPRHRNAAIGAVSTRRVRRAAALVGCRRGNGAVFPAVCGDPGHRVQTGSDRRGAKGLLHID